MRSLDQFLECQFKITLLLEQAARMAPCMNQPGGRDAKFALLVAEGHAIGVFKPLRQRRVFAGDQLAKVEEAESQSRPRATLHHLLEAAARNNLDMQVDTFFHQSPKDARLIPISAQALGHAVFLDDPETNGLAPPDRLFREAAYEDRRQEI